MTHRIRTTKCPWQELEVADAEYLDLKRQGLLLEDPDPAPQAATPTAPKKTTTKDQ
ncbi:hypothetical protein [Streptomyces sp. NPDC085596]|uniref:hypothetical protein n=1 Tax=Streptomyces sp. NPDC085596 TaxID=3365731 RepID=UPI0037D4A887